MSKSKKANKKRPASMPRTTLKVGISQAQFKRGCTIARKMLRLLNYDPAVFDGFSKKQKEFLLNSESPPPIIEIERGSMVPRRYVNAIRNELYDFLHSECVDQATNFTFMELFTYGIPFVLMLEIMNHKKLATETRNIEFLERFDKDSQKNEIFKNKWFDDLYLFLDFETSLYSQVNFRTYGYDFSYDVLSPQKQAGFGLLRIEIKLNSQESESVHFIHNGIRRKAFRVKVGSNARYEAAYAVMPHKALFPEAADDERRYALYIQSHAIQRFKERMDVFETTERNHILNTSMAYVQSIIKGGDGNLLLACSIRKNTFGYYPFVIQDDKLFILSFLPVVSTIVPEGAKLNKLLGLAKNDLIHLGMDKMSFYLSVDFDRIPMLRDALKMAGIWKMKQMLDEVSTMRNIRIDETKTEFVKNFFLKLALRNASQFPELETADATNTTDTTDTDESSELDLNRFRFAEPDFDANNPQIPE